MADNSEIDNPATCVNPTNTLLQSASPETSTKSSIMSASPDTGVQTAQDSNSAPGSSVNDAKIAVKPAKGCGSAVNMLTVGPGQTASATVDDPLDNSRETDVAQAGSEKENHSDPENEQDTEMEEAAPATTTLSPSGELVPEHPGWQFWRETLRGARLVVAPMVDASELAWRLLSRRYGAELCYTPMLHSVVLVRDPRYRRDSLQTCPEDRPLLVQVCANDPAVLGEACRLVSPHCDGVDINLGCPQAIARKGRYGAFLMDDWALIERLVRSAVASSSVPVTCKIRVYPSHAKTVQYALMLQRAGAALLTVHGRTRDQKGPQTGLADWSYVKAVRNAVKVPVFANGNVQYRRDVERCLSATGAQGVMSAEGNLHNPALFADPAHFGRGSKLFAHSAPYVTADDSAPGPAPTVWQMALEYLDLVLEYPCPISYTRGHLFKLLHHCFSMAENSDIRQSISRSNSVLEMKTAVELLQQRMEPFATGQRPWEPDTPALGALPLPPWLCQPYVRIPPDLHAKRCEEGQRRAQDQRDQRLADRLKELHSLNGGEAEDSVATASLKRTLEDRDGDEKEADLLLLTGDLPHLSKKKAKKLLRNPRKKFPGQAIENFNLCVCRSPRGGKCEHSLCKACCKSRCYREDLDCKGHRIWVRTSRLKATTLPPKAVQVPSQAKPHTASGLETKTAANGCPNLKEINDRIMVTSVIAEPVSSVESSINVNNGVGAAASEENKCPELPLQGDTLGR